MPQVFLQPNNANYYKHTHDHALYRRSVWQYMFGGLMRAIFGIYSNSRYWEPEMEKALMAHMKAEYLESKKRRIYGIYFFTVATSCTIAGKLWPHGQRHLNRPPGIHRFWLRKGGVLCARINRLETKRNASIAHPTGHSKGRVDIEFQPICIPPFPILGVSTVSIPYVQFERMLKRNLLRRLPDDGKIYKIRASAKRGLAPKVEGA